MSVTASEDLIAASPLQSPGVELHWRKDGARKTPIIKDKLRGRYHRVSIGSAWVWSLCDGEHTIGMISENIAARGGPAETSAVIAAVHRLAKDGLVQGIAVETPLPSDGPRDFAATCSRVLTWRVTFTHVDPLMTWLYDHLAFLAFKPAFRLFSILLMVSGGAAFLTMWLTRPDPYMGASSQWAYFLPFFLFSTVLPHEAAHAMANKHFKRDVIGAGFGWFWLGPVFYVDTSDMWLGGRRERVLVGLAGTLSDLTIAGVCSLLALTAPAPLSAAATALYLVVLGNLSPLLEYDGYYVLADLLNRPNLRRRSLRRLCDTLSRHPIQWRSLVQDKVEFAYCVGSLACMPFLLISSAYFNHAFFSNLFGHSAGVLASVLTWAVTTALLLVFLFGLGGDIRRSGQTSSRSTGGR